MRMIYALFFCILTFAELIAQAPGPNGLPEGEKATVQPPIPPIEVDFSSLKVRSRSLISAYPALARIGKVQGNVALKLTINPKGWVATAVAIGGPMSLRPTAEAILCQWAFDPVLIEGKPVWAQTQLEVPFQLKEGLPEEGGDPGRQVVFDLEVEQTPLSVPVDEKAIRAEAQKCFASLGLTLAEPSKAIPSKAYYLNMKIQAVRTYDGIYLQNVMERCSLLADRNLQDADPKLPGRIWFSNHVLGQRGGAGFQQSLLWTVSRTLRELAIPEIQYAPGGTTSVKSDGVKQSDGPDSRNPIIPTEAMNFDFSQIKIRRQPPAPPYPVYAKQRSIEGTVVLMLTIDPSGRPASAEAMEGPSELLPTAIRYALDWDFDPARLNGVPQVARFRLTLPFVLGRTPTPHATILRR